MAGAQYVSLAVFLSGVLEEGAGEEAEEPGLQVALIRACCDSAPAPELTFSSVETEQ